MRTVAIIQARAGSTRLRGKVLRELHGKPMLAHQIERVLRSKRIHAVVVATTAKREDDPVAELAHSLGVSTFRGEEHDVLDRFYRAAKEHSAGIIVRLTGDCPLTDPEVIDQVLSHFEESEMPLDYTSTPRNYPEGLDCEVFTFAALEAAWKDAVLPSEREHVTPFIKNHPEKFVCNAWVSGGRDNSSMHWSVDTKEDFHFVEAVYRALYDSNPTFGYRDVLAMLEAQPELLALNVGGTGYEGLAKSLEEDEAFRTRNL